jgi:trehalose-phosphatase
LPGTEENAVAPGSGIPVEIEQFLCGVAKSPASVLLLDYDGTLAPFCIDREQAFPYPGVTAILQEIMLAGRTRLAIVTGRNAHEVIPLLALRPHPEIWGSHGLERLRADGTYDGPRVEAPVVQALADADRWLTHEGLHDRAESKTGAIAVHWRGMDEATAAETRNRVLRGWAPIAQSVPMQLLEFDGGIEMRMPDLDKGDAVRLILKETGPGVPIAYLGDDLTDEHAFLALGGSGLTVLVRPQWRATAAAHWIKPPEELMDFLARWLRACRE